MERSLIKQVNQKNMAARLNTRFVKPMFFLNFFGIKRVSSLNWRTLVGEKGAPVVADVISFDASAPQKTREVIGKLSGDIPKTSAKRAMNESDYNEYLNLMNSCKSEADLIELLNLAFKDLDFVYNAVLARFEWWCMQIMSRGGFTLSASNNNGIVTSEFVGCGMPKDHRLVSAADWSNVNTADGLQDIADVVAKASQSGFNIRYVVMHAADFTLLKKQKATIDTIKGWVNQSAKLVLTKKIINEYLSEQEIPVQIVVVNPAVRIEDASHRRKTVCPWERKRIAFIEEIKIGDVQHGPIAAENSAAVAKVAIMVKKDFVLITKFSELDPFKEFTKAEANAFPVVNDPEAMFILKADGQAWPVNEDTEGTDNVPAQFLGEEVKPESLAVEE